MKFSLSHFILSDEIINGIFFIKSLSDSLLLVYRNGTHLYTDFVSYKFTKFIDTFNSFLVESLGFSIHNIMPSANSGSFTSSLPI